MGIKAFSMPQIKKKKKKKRKIKVYNMKLTFIKMVSPIGMLSNISPLKCSTLVA